jgi:hypothetical protein
MRRILQASDEVHIPPENWSLGYVIYHFRRNSWHLDWKQIVDLVIASHEHRTQGWFDAPPTEFVEEAIEWPAEKQTLHHLIDALYRYHGRTVEATFTRWGDKTPLNVNVMDGIRGVFPNACFIHMLRDGVDVVHSWLKHGYYGQDLIAPSERWQKSVAAARAFSCQYPDQVIEVRYEDLCRQPEDTVQRICEFLDLSYRPQLLHRTSHYDEMEKARSVSHFQKAFESISTDSIGKGRESLTDEQKRTVSHIIGENLVRLGYNPVFR